MRCALCYRPIRSGGSDVLVVRLQGSLGEVVELRWHLGGGGPLASRLGHEPDCADEDALHARLADALAIADGPEGDRASEVAYLAIRDRAAEKGASILRDVVNVRRDLPGAVTLRGAGLDWGRMVRRAGHAR